MVDCQIQGYIKSLKYEGTSWKSKCTFQVWENLKKFKWTLQVWGNFSKVFKINSKALIDLWSIGFYQASQSHHRFYEAGLSHHCTALQGGDKSSISKMSFCYLSAPIWIRMIILNIIWYYLTKIFDCHSFWSTKRQIF